MPTSSMTKLEAVNEVLSGVNQRAVNEIGDNANGVAAQAERILDQAARFVLNEGFFFNRDFEVELAFDENGFIFVPSTYTRISVPRNRSSNVSGGNTRAEIVQRGSRLYNLVANTYVFTVSVKVDAWSFMIFYDMPESAKIYTTARALRLMSDRMFGENTRHAQMARDELTARTVLVADEEMNGEYNIFDDPETGFGIVTRPNILTRMNTLSS